MRIISFELFPGRTLHLLLFELVDNVHNIRDRLLKGEFELSLINTDLILDDFQIGIAATKAIAAQKSAKMKTKNLHSELIFQLGCQKNIGDTLKKFGLSDKTPGLIVGIFDATSEKIALVRSLIKGNEVPFSCKHANLPAIRKCYSITETELAAMSLSNCIATRIAVWDV